MIEVGGGDLTRTGSGPSLARLLFDADDDLPFGGMGAYHGIEGFHSMSHSRGVFIQSRWDLPALLRAPFGRLADIALRATLGKSRQRV